MKKVLLLTITLIMLLSSVSCDNKQADTSVFPDNITEKDIRPKIHQMKSICELAVMECYYHDVAKYTKAEAEKGFLGIGKKDRKFWIEYETKVTVGIDVSLVNIEISDDIISITIPDARIMRYDTIMDNDIEHTHIAAKDSADISAYDEQVAIKMAQSKLLAEAAADQTILANAQQRAQTLLEEYITNIGNTVGKQYTIKWIYIDESGNPYKTTVEAPTQSPETAATEQTAA